LAKTISFSGIGRSCLGFGQRPTTED